MLLDVLRVHRFASTATVAEIAESPHLQSDQVDGADDGHVGDGLPAFLNPGLEIIVEQDRRQARDVLAGRHACQVHVVRNGHAIDPARE